MSEQTRVAVSQQQMRQQHQYAQMVRTLLDQKLGPQRYYHIRTYGCQMNVNDSQKLAGYLEQMGYQQTGDETRADLIVFNTCCVRDSAERRIHGHIGQIKALYEQNPDLIVCVCGCMVQQEGAAQALQQRFPFVRVCFGTHNLYAFPQMIFQVLSGQKRARSIIDAPTVAEDVPVVRDGVCAYTTIMYGCDNFCSYCIVPYVRGRERSRDMAQILDELRALRDQGVHEVMLLGQNVDSYGKGIDGASFDKLLEQADQVGIERIRFMTSHPKDISGRVLEVMANSRHICHQLHLPVQSGSDAILTAMNRRYSAQRYLQIVEQARALMPDIGLTTDIIVGFPGETEADFEQTLDLVRAARFDSAFTFKYSPRRGTKAAQMDNQISAQVKKERIVRLIALQDEITAGVHQQLVGTRQVVLAEGPAARSPGQYAGRIDRGVTVNFKSQTDVTGQLVPVEITQAKRNTVMGQICPQA